MKANNNATLRFSAYGDPAPTGDKVHWLYFPTFAEKFVTVCFENDYKLWDEVFELIMPFLGKYGVGLISIARSNNYNVKYGQSVNGISLPHAAYLIEKSLCHVCAADWSLSLAQHNGQRPVFAKTQSDQVIYNKELYGDGVDDLERPEIFAKAILDALGIEETIAIETIMAGSSYNDTFLEIIPDLNISDARINNTMNIGIRCDLHENWNFVLAMVQRGATPTVIANTLPPQPILPFIKNIKKLNLLVDESDFSIERLKMIEDLGIPYDFLSRKDDIPEIKYRLFDFKQVKAIEPPTQEYLDKLKQMSYDTRIKSKRSLVSKDGTFLSIYHWKNKISIADPKGHMILDGAEDEDFISESDLFLYYRRIQ